MAWFGLIIIMLSVHEWRTIAVEYKLNGAAYFVYSLDSNQPTSPKSKSTIHMLFRTAEPSGLLIHGRGTNGDFFTLELVRGKLRYSSVFDRGSPKPGSQDVIVGDDLGDDQWHQIDIERHGNDVKIILDITRKKITPKEKRKPLNINGDLTVGGLQPRSANVPIDPLLPRPSITGNAFKGCMEDVTYNNMNIFQAIEQKWRNVHAVGNFQLNCTEDLEFFPPATLTRPTSFIQLNMSEVVSLNLEFKFRTFDHSGILVYHSFRNPGDGRLLVELVLGKLWLKYSSDALETQVHVSPKISTLANGLWNKIQLNFSHGEIAIRINDETRQRIFNVTQLSDRHFQEAVLRIGYGHSGKSSIIGCVKEIHLNGQKNVEIRSEMTRDVEIDKCYLIDQCFSNPCLHNGRCLEHNNTAQCDCSQTGYHGTHCEKPLTNVDSINTTNIPSLTPPSTKTTIPTNTSMVKRPLLESKLSTEYSISQIISTSTAPSVIVKIANTTSSAIMSTKTSQIVNLVSTSTYISQDPISSTKKLINVSDSSSHAFIITKLHKTIAPSSTRTESRSHPSSVWIIRPTTEQTTRKNDQRIIIIEKRNEFTPVGFNKDQILVYLFLSIVFILFIGLVVIITLKISRLKLCKCFQRRYVSSRESLSGEDPLELSQQDAKDDIEAMKQRKGRPRRPPSLNDSGIDPSDSGAGSNRSSAEVNPETTEELTDLGTPIDFEIPESSKESSPQGFLVLQEDPSLYTQRSFGWFVSESPRNRHSRVFTDVCAENEHELRTIDDERWEADLESENEKLQHFEDDANFEKSSGKTRDQNTARYYQLHGEDCSNLENVYIDIKP